MRRLPSYLQPIATIALLGIASHGLILLTDYVIWDGWWYSHFIRNRSETPYLTRILREIGRPQDILFFLPFFATNDITFLSKLLGVTGWVAAAMFQFGFLRTALQLPGHSALAMTACSLSAPLFPFCGELTYNMYILAVALFWLAWWLTGMRLERSANGLAVRLLSVLLFALSFELNSNIAHLYAVGLLVILYKSASREPASWHRKCGLLAQRYGELVFLPVIYWVCKNTFTPTCGYYGSYNALKLIPSIILNHYVVFLSSFPAYLARLLYESGQVGCAAMLSVVGFTLLYRKKADAFAAAVMPPHPARLLGASTFLFLCSIFSYCAVDQPVLCEGWAARNTILTNVPLGVMVVSGCAALSHTLRQAATLIVLAPVTLFIVAGLIECNRTTLRWQAFGAKQLCVQAAVRELVDAENAERPQEFVNVVNLRDYYTLPHTLPWYPPIVWTYMIAPGDAEPTVFVIDTRLWIPDEVQNGIDGRPVVVPPKVSIGPSQLRDLMEGTTQPYALKQIPLDGRTINVVVTGGDLGADGVAIGRRYLELRFLEPSSLRDYVAKVAKVTRLN